jgi:hypothetical protein
MRVRGTGAALVRQGAGHDGFLRLLRCVDGLLRQFGLPPYYQDPTPHASVASMLGAQLSDERQGGWGGDSALGGVVFSGGRCESGVMYPTAGRRSFNRSVVCRLTGAPRSTRRSSAIRPTVHCANTSSCLGL